MTRELARRLTGRGHSVTTLVPRQSGTPDAAPADAILPDRGRVIRYVIPAESGLAAFLRAGRDACGRLLDRDGPASFDVAHSHFAWAARGPVQALPKGVARVRTFHGPWDEECYVEEAMAAAGPAGRLLARLKRLLRARVERDDIAASDRVTVLSDSFRALTTRYGVDPTEVVKIPGGVDTDRFRPDPEGRTAARARLALPADRRILLSVRRLAPRMGLDSLIAAMPTVLRRFPDVLLLIGGKGPHRAALEAAVAAAGVGENVRLVGFIPDDQLVDYYRAADLFVLPTLALEGFGLVTCEALSAGTPVVGTPVGATPEILGGLDRRLLSEGAEAEALAAAICRFLEGRAAPHGWASDLTPEFLHAFVSARYSWDRHADAVEEVYRDALARRHERSAGGRR